MSEKPIREYDRFIIRLPDGMRERLAQRASGSGRSMNAEAVAILDAALADSSEIRLQQLAVELERLNEMLAAETRHIAEIQHKRQVAAVEYAVLAAKIDAKNRGEKPSNASEENPPEPSAVKGLQG